MSDGNVWPEEQKNNTRQGGGCLRGCLVMGIVVVVAGLIVGGTLVFFGYQIFSKGFSQDSATINGWLQDTVASEIPPGYEAKLGLSFWNLRLIFIAPADKAMGEEGKDEFMQFIVCSFPGLDFDTLRDQFDEQHRRRSGNKDVEELKEEDVVLTVGTTPTQGRKRSWKQEGTPWVEYDVLVKPGVLFVAMAPADRFDEPAMTAFLASMKVEAKEEEAVKEQENAEPVEKGTDPVESLVEPVENGADAGPAEKPADEVKPEAKEGAACRFPTYAVGTDTLLLTA